ncbi:MAG: hypothetical protein LW817_07165, partial [Candidatus Caenarcaniphilales bacterium]|nr:hypothetical protein [Candidatus Caenarcaniphilales bacterium]
MSGNVSNRDANLIDINDRRISPFDRSKVKAVDTSGDNNASKSEVKNAAVKGGALEFLQYGFPGMSQNPTSQSPSSELTALQIARAKTFGNANSSIVSGWSTQSENNNAPTTSGASTSSKPENSRLEILNPQDYSNLPKFGVPRAALDNPNNIFGIYTDSKGEQRVVFASAGHGESDKRSGFSKDAIDVKGDVKTAGNAWKAASSKEEQAVIQKHETEIKSQQELVGKYGGTKGYKGVKDMLADIGDIKASGIITQKEKLNELNALETALKEPKNDFKLEDHKSTMTKF